MDQVHHLSISPSKGDSDGTEYQLQPKYMQGNGQNEAFLSDKQAEGFIKLAMISDSKEYKIKIVLAPAQTNQAVSLLASWFRVQVCLSEAIDESIFRNIYYPTCLITNNEVYDRFSQQINRCFYISHVIIIQELGYFQVPPEPITKVIRMDEKEIISAIQEPIAHNFIIGRGAKLDEFKQKIRVILQLKRSRKFYRRKWRKYLRITGFGEQEAKDFMDKYRPTPENILRLYSESSHIHQINIIMRRCNRPSILEYLGLMIQLLYQGIAASVPSRKLREDGRVCFRGGSVGMQEVEQLASASVEPVLCRYFMSCSLNPNVADHFRINCIFQIHFQPDAGCAIVKDSVYDEEEVIFSVLSRFRVISVREDRMREEQGWYVVLSYQGPANIDLI